MKNITRKLVTFFAVFGAALMLSSAFVQPVSAKASGQVDVLQKYDRYLSEIEKFGKELSTDKNLIALSNRLSNRLSKNSELNKIIEEVKSVDTIDELKVLGERFENTLTKHKEYKQIVDILNSNYKEELTALKSFINILKSKPADAEALLTAIAERNPNIKNIQLTKSSDEFAIPVQLPPVQLPDGNAKHEFAIPVQSSSGNVKSVASGVTTYKHNSKAQHVTFNKVNGNIRYNSGAQHMGSVSTYAMVKQDLNGNTYIYIPGQGWVSTTWFPGYWLLVLLFLIWDAIVFVITWIIGVLIPGIISIIGHLIIYIVIIIWWIINRIKDRIRG